MIILDSSDYYIVYAEAIFHPNIEPSHLILHLKSTIKTCRKIPECVQQHCQSLQLRDPQECKYTYIQRVYCTGRI